MEKKILQMFILIIFGILKLEKVTVQKIIGTMIGFIGGYLSILTK